MAGRPLDALVADEGGREPRLGEDLSRPLAFMAAPHALFLEPLRADERFRPDLVHRIQRDEMGALFLREPAIDHIWSPVPSVARCRAESNRFAIPNRVCGIRGQVNIRDLVPGDIVLLHTMGEVLAYKVDSSEAVWPDEMDSLGIQQGKDLLTLVTCTPYGLNDHRLLVHCERTEYVPEEAEAQGGLANRRWGMCEWAVLIVAVVLLLVLLDVIVHRIRQKRKAKASPKHME